MHTNILLEKLKERNHVEVLAVDGKMLSDRVLGK
jgi:hypothetical protein